MIILQRKFFAICKCIKTQNLNSQIMKFTHAPSTITVKPQKFNPQKKLFCKDSQISSLQNFHAIQYL